MKPTKLFTPFGKYNGFVVPNVISRLPNMTDSDKQLLGRLVQFGGKDGNAFPSRKKLAYELGWQLGKLDRTIKSLKELKFIRTYQENANSPSIYTFLPHEAYKNDTPFTKNGSTKTLTKNSKRVLTKNNKRVLTKFGKHKRINIEENQYRSNLSKDKLPVQKTGKRKRRKKQDNKINTEHKAFSVLDKFDSFLSTDTKKILLYWLSKGGKVPMKQTKENKHVILHESIVTALLIEGLNPYSKVLTDENLSLNTKKWEIQEILSCIDYFVDTLKKDTSKLMFSDFVINVTSNKVQNKQYRLQNSFSSLADVFLELDYLPTKESQKLKATFLNGTPIPEKVFIMAAAKVNEISKKFIITDAACSSLNKNMLNAFIQFVKEKNNRDSFDVKYMCGDGFIEDFNKTMLKRNVIAKRR